MAAMRDAIDRSIDLIDMMTAQAHQEMVDDKMLQLTVILLVVTLATVATVTSDSIKFISEHPEHKVIASLELYGPLLILALGFFVWFKRRTR